MAAESRRERLSFTPIASAGLALSQVPSLGRRRKEMGCLRKSAGANRTSSA